MTALPPALQEHESTPAMARAYRIVNVGPAEFAFTDLTKTRIGDEQNRFFRLFVPVKQQRMRLPTALPEFRTLRHFANLSDSPVTAAARLGGRWSDYNLAAITQVAACNFRCTYCYVDFRHLAGHDAFTATPADVVDEFLVLRSRLREQGRTLAILRISGGEPLLAPRLLVGVHGELVRRQLLHTKVVLKAESNASALPFAMSRMEPRERQALRAAAPDITLHVTLHSRPGGRDWDSVVKGLAAAVELGFDVYPAIGGADWPREDMVVLFESLRGIAPGLPLRLAVRPFILSYEILRDRRSLPQLDENSDAPSLLWEGILQERLGVSYMEQPRHAVALI
ncbi:hypothetical protein [Streptomyces sp. NPDC017940]|uniref:hypothetical protein n=1 Tax=Streptomyces sp. NPDC017940 TaxID=3365017 RepID=UPI00379AFFAA